MGTITVYINLVENLLYIILRLHSTNAMYCISQRIFYIDTFIRSRYCRGFRIKLRIVQLHPKMPKYFAMIEHRDMCPVNVISFLYESMFQFLRRVYVSLEP